MELDLDETHLFLVYCALRVFVSSEQRKENTGTLVTAACGLLDATTRRVRATGSIQQLSLVQQLKGEEFETVFICGTVNEMII